MGERHASGHGDTSVYLALLAGQIGAGSMAVFAKVALQESIDPFLYNAGRIVVATPLLFLLAWRTEPVFRLSRQHYRDIATLGVFGVTLNQLLNISGLGTPSVLCRCLAYHRHRSHGAGPTDADTVVVSALPALTTATTTGVLQTTIPVLTTALSMWLQREARSWVKAAGILCAVLGAVLMMPLDKASFDADHLAGNLLVLGNCVSFSIYLVMQKPVLRRIPPFSLTAWTFAFGGALILAVTAVKAAITPYSWRHSPLVWSAVLYAGLVGTFLVYILNSWSMKRSSPSVISGFATVQPLTTAVLAAVFLAERLHWINALGAVLIFAGLLLVSWAKRKEAAAIAALPHEQVSLATGHELLPQRSIDGDPVDASEDGVSE